MLLQLPLVSLSSPVDLLLQAVTYLYTAWEALASREGVPMARLRPTFEDASIVQAVQAQAGEDVTLSVLLDRRGRFQVPRTRTHAPCCAAGICTRGAPDSQHAARGYSCDRAQHNAACF